MHHKASSRTGFFLLRIPGKLLGFQLGYIRQAANCKILLLVLILYSLNIQEYWVARI
ncbi:hypothetical protein AHMF7616_04042 [Adhaeribacter pallidiroseus]|uniref:Uncharacterized protein n=1 Tax=Adhaeribacter pallidiroseus TaxID=2072847 RepID=A0A369QM19_9BACT|nr:hypothetical protein AHMF7616_04042 [Adhaeribacter pallidiroseus]